MRPIRVYVGLNSAETVEARAAAGARRADPGRRLRPLGARRHGADRHRLDGPGGDGHARISARRRHRDRRGAVFLPDQLDLAAGRAGLRRPRPAGRCSAPSTGTGPALPRDARPRLYLYGLSLGAYGSEQSVAAARGARRPVQRRGLERPAVLEPDLARGDRERNPGTPEWLPRFGDGSLVRFTNQENHLDIPGAALGADADRLPAVRQRPDHLLQPRARSGASPTG